MGVIKFVDFGAAKVLAKNHKTIAAKTRVQGADGNMNSLTGTPMYMSPEVIKGDHRGRRGAMDIWSLGCVVLECATGRRPWSNLDNEWWVINSALQDFASLINAMSFMQGYHVPYRYSNPASTLTGEGSIIRAWYRFR
jgi:serine/threonine protein kinase